MDPLIIGIGGMSLILLAFILNQLRVWTSDNLYYDITNLLGSLLLFYYSYTLESIPFLILNTVWAIFSLKDIIIKIFFKLYKL
jgi:hypothetical protein